MRKLFCFLIVMFFILNFSQAWACASSEPNCKSTSTSDADANATGIGVGISDSDSTAIVGVNSENTNMNLNAPVAIGGGADVDNKNISNNIIKNDVQNTNIITPIVAPVIAPNVSVGAISGSYSGPSTSSVGNTITGDSTSEAVNNVQVGDSVSNATIGDVLATSGDSTSTIGDTISTSEIGDINAGNSFESSYFNSQKLDSYDTFIQVGNTRKSVPNISGYAGMNRYDYRDSWEFGIRMTIPLFTGVTDKAIEYETAKIETENDYLNAQITALNADNERKQAVHTMEIQNIQQAYVADRQQVKEKHQAEMAVLCKGIKETLKQVEGSNDLWQICNGFELVTPPVKIVEKVKWRTAKPKLTPCELCEKEKQTIVTTPAN
jgi:hypothetical protein